MRPFKEEQGNNKKIIKWVVLCQDFLFCQQPEEPEKSNHQSGNKKRGRTLTVRDDLISVLNFNYYYRPLLRRGKLTPFLAISAQKETIQFSPVSLPFLPYLAYSLLKCQDSNKTKFFVCFFLHYNLHCSPVISLIIQIAVKIFNQN